MIAGIIGDLAASTWLRDKSVFYHKLFDEEATISEYGLSAIAAAAVLADAESTGADCDKDGALERTRRIFSSYISLPQYRADISETARQWADDFAFRHTPASPGMMLIRLAVAGWYSDSADDGTSRASWQMMIDRSWDKEEGYARMFVPKMIALLRTGHTKDETYTALGEIFRGIRRNWDWQRGESTLCLLMRAWDCFYRAFDFGSAIHNAVRDCPENPRLMASLTAMIAGAMYGHAIYYIKEKYSTDGETRRPLYLPDEIRNTYREEINAMTGRSKWQNIFFAKNNALTNVERHLFKPVKSRYDGLTLTDEEARRIVKGFYTDWEARFGFYLDNGRIYIYRSHYLLGRFRLAHIAANRWTITDTQVSDEMPDMLDFDKCFKCAFDITLIAPQTGFRYYRFSWGTPADRTNPYHENQPNKRRYWEYEHDFYINEYSRFGYWLGESAKALKDLNEHNSTRLPIIIERETFAIIYYIHTRMKATGSTADINAIADDYLLPEN